MCLKDLVVLVADSDMEAGFNGLLLRHQSLAIRSVTFEIFRHPSRDPGCRTDAHNFLRPHTGSFAHGLVVLDRYGCGEDSPAEEIEARIEANLVRNGWDDRAAAIVIDPELEAWVWSASPHVAGILGWGQRNLALNDWLIQNGFLTEGILKPLEPKKAMQEVLRTVSKVRSQHLYRKLAEQVSLVNCQDRAFNRLCTVLREWFPVD